MASSQETASPSPIDAPLQRFLTAHLGHAALPIPLADGWALVRAAYVPRDPPVIDFTLANPNFSDVTGYLAEVRAGSRSFKSTRRLALSFYGDAAGAQKAALEPAFAALVKTLAAAEAHLPAAQSQALWADLHRVTELDEPARPEDWPPVAALEALVQDPSVGAASRLLAVQRLLQVGRFDLGLAALDTLGAEAVSPPVWTALQEAQLAWYGLVGRYHDAWAALQRINATAGASPETQRRAMTFWLKLGDFARTAAAAEQAAATSEDPSVLLAAGQLLNQLDNPHGLACLERVLDMTPPSTQTLLQIAREFLYAGQDARAVALLQPVLAQAPDHPEANLILARRHLWLGAVTEAARDLACVQAHRPQDPEALTLAGACAYLQGDWPGALALLERSLALVPLQSEALLWKTEILGRQGRKDEAFQAVVLAIRSNDYGVYRNHFADVLNEWLKHPMPAERARESGATANAAAPSMAELRTLAGAAATLLPKVSAMAMPVWIALRADSRQRPEMVDTLRRTYAWFARSMVVAKSREGVSTNDFGHAYLYDRLHAESPPVGLSLDRNVRGAQYDAMLKRLRGNRSPHVVIVPGDANPPRLERLILGEDERTACEQLQMSLQYQSVADVLTTFDGLVASHPTSQHPHAYRGELYLWLGRYEDARADFYEALRCYMPTRWAYYGLAAAAFLLDDPQQASAWLNLGTAMWGDYGSIHAYRGECALRLGRIDDALSDLETSAAYAPGRIAGWLALAVARHAAGQTSGVETIFQRLMTQAPRLLVDAALAESLVLTLPILPPPHEQLAILRRARAMMRGNLSSRLPTYFTPAGEFRIVAKQHALPPILTRGDAASVQLALEPRQGV